MKMSKDTTLILLAALQVFALINANAYVAVIYLSGTVTEALALAIMLNVGIVMAFKFIIPFAADCFSPKALKGPITFVQQK